MDRKNAAKLASSPNKALVFKSRKESREDAGSLEMAFQRTQLTQVS